MVAFWLFMQIVKTRYNPILMIIKTLLIAIVQK